jgi:hypothetical protein
VKEIENSLIIKFYIVTNNNPHKWYECVDFHSNTSLSYGVSRQLVSCLGNLGYYNIARRIETNRTTFVTLPYRNFLCFLRCMKSSSLISDDLIRKICCWVNWCHQRLWNSIIRTPQVLIKPLDDHMQQNYPGNQMVNFIMSHRSIRSRKTSESHSSKLHYLAWCIVVRGN